jgi:hypothetical protein
VPRYFHITPFGAKATRDGKAINFDEIRTELVEKAAKEAGFDGGTTGIVFAPGSIHEDMFQLILEADTVICDVSLHNANVWYELGIRHAMRKKNTVLIKAQPSDDTPFDVLTFRYVEYDAKDPGSARKALVSAIKEGVVAEQRTDSPVFKMLPKLEEPDPEKLRAVPREFAEEVERAKAGSSVGWLRLLGEEVRGLRFERPGLRLIGAAQLGIKDYDGAGRTWGTVQEQVPDDIEANFALADIFERKYRRVLDPVILKESDLAILRALDNSRVSEQQRAEGLAFHGRNAKTRWRLKFKDAPRLEERRKIAINQNLIDIYTAYRNAFLIDLNHFWSGLAALQMNTIALDLAREPFWSDRFVDAERRREDLKKEHAELFPVVARGITCALERISQGKSRNGDNWADVSKADLMFIDGKHVELLKSCYCDAINGDAFKRDAAVGQLRLFEALGIRGEDAKDIIAEIYEHFPKGPTYKPSQCVVVVAGHQIDEPGRNKKRFPATAELNARQKLSSVLSKLKQDYEQVTVFASAASGTDILCHETCADIGIKSTICLPIPPTDFATQCLCHEGNWRNRFTQLTNGARERTLVLSRSTSLPKWLSTKEQDLWQRGNRWVVEMANSLPANRRVLVALWDGQREDTSGGTAEVVKLAEARGFEITAIPTVELTNAKTGVRKAPV